MVTTHRLMTADEVQAEITRFCATLNGQTGYIELPREPCKSHEDRREYRKLHKQKRAMQRRKKRGLT